MILITCDKLESSVYPRVVKMKFIVRVLQSLITILKPHNAVELIIDEELLAQGGYLLCWVPRDVPFSWVYFLPKNFKAGYFLPKNSKVGYQF